MRYPAVRIDLRVTNLRVDLVAERFDLAIRASLGKQADSTLTARRLDLGPVGFYASPSYVARRGQPRDFGDAKHEWVLMPAMRTLLRVPKALQPRVQVDDLLTLRNLLREGAGVGALPQFVTERDVAEGRLERVRLPPMLPAAGLSIVYPSSGQVPRKVTAFRDFVVERIKARPLSAS